MKDLVIGIDTSAYTTSLCVVQRQTQAVVYEKRKILDVPAGERGLRQNTAIFQHMKNLPYFIEELFSELSPERIAAIAVTDKPRPIEGSYMPVFFSGHTYARVLAAGLSAPLYTFSHQEGHIAAGLGTLESPMSNQSAFLAIHISGGTSEICMATTTGDTGSGYKITLLGGTTDLHAGQFVDRIGVKMGLSFPAGRSLEQLAWESTSDVEIPSSVKGYDFSFSGPATMAERLLNQEDATYSHGDIARAVENCIVRTLAKVIVAAKDEYHLHNVLIVGGVASNRYIRTSLEQRMAARAKAIKLYFAKPEYSSDNAYGTSLLGLQRHFI